MQKKTAILFIIMAILFSLFPVNLFASAKQPSYRVVAVSSASIRSKPSASAKVIAKARKTEILEYISVKGKYTRVKTAKDIDGYVLSKSIKTSSSADIAMRILRTREDVGQLVLCRAKTAPKASVSLYEKKSGVWYETYSGLPAVTGRKGVSVNKKEGDGKSPVGIFNIEYLFGASKQSFNKLMDYMQATERDYWVDDPNSEEYNQWVRLEDGENPRWESAEKLLISAYEKAAVIGYNTDPVVAGKGSAIFMHKWLSSSKGTAGCIALSKDNLLKLLSKLNSKKAPRIAIGTDALLKKM